jgi:hypothetical protein
MNEVWFDPTNMPLYCSLMECMNLEGILIYCSKDCNILDNTVEILS